VKNSVCREGQPVIEHRIIVRLENKISSYLPMFLIPLQFVLLFAVATSQIFGGISCCCLGRTLFADMLAVKRSTATELASQHEFSSELQERQTGKCPKCSARKSSPAALEQSTSNPLHDRRDKVCEDSQCRCVKHFVNASTPNDPPFLSHDSDAWLIPFPDVKPEREVLTLILAKFEVPARFGGHSWQSIACVWNN